MRLWLTSTPDSTTVPQLVTVNTTATVLVGGSTAGTFPGALEEGALQLSPTMPGPPDVATVGTAGGTAGGTRPAEVMTNWWNGNNAGEAARAAAEAPSRTGPSGASTLGEGSHTEAGRWTGMRWC